MSIQSVAILILLLTLSFATLAQSSEPLAFKERIIRAERPEVGDDAKPQIQIIDISVNNNIVKLNTPFFAPDDWLSKLQIRVRNIGGKKLSCVAISFGLLAEINTKLQPYESWPNALEFHKGSCGRMSKDTNFSLGPGREITLSSADIPEIYRISTIGVPLAKAVLHRDGGVRIKKRKVFESPLLLPRETHFLVEDPY